MELSTDVALRMLRLLILPGTTDVISSPASADGRSLSNSQIRLAAGACGQPVALASLSARQAKAQGLLTSGTYGRRSSTLLSNADLTRSLASKLLAEAHSNGSTLYTMTAKVRVTPSGLRICALRASARRKSGNGFTGWPTATARDWKGATKEKWGNNARPLNEVAVLSGWPTPLASDALKGGLVTPRKNAMALPETAQVVGPVRYTASGEILTGSSAGMERGGQLHPAHSLWLMGYPVRWLWCVPFRGKKSSKKSIVKSPSKARATRSSRSSRPSS